MVLNSRLDVGVNVATNPEYEMAPGMVTPPAVSVKEAASSVFGAMRSLKVARSTWVTGTPAASFTGTTATTVGTGVIVVNFHTYFAGSGVPA